MAPDYCVYVGRFRIFHRGYREVTNHILAETGCRLIIAVGAAQVPPCKDSPFTGKERALMIEAVLKEEGLQSRSKVVTIDETDATYGNWTHLVEGLCPPFSLIYSHSDLVRSLFRRAGYMVKPVPDSHRLNFPLPQSRTRSSIMSHGNIYCQGRLLILSKYTSWTGG